MRRIPFYTSEEIFEKISATDLSKLIRDAYTKFYDPQNMNKKIRLQNKTSHDIIIMPFHDQREIVINKVMLMEKGNKIPGVFGWMTVYDIEKHQPVAIIDATALTGIRTAAKSLLMSQICFKKEWPKHIYIYGSSTQALYHYNVFSSYYKNAFFYFIVRSKEAEMRLRNSLKKTEKNFNITCNQSNIIEDPDIIITATKTKKPLINNLTIRSSKLLLCVGSSSGEKSEIELDIVASSKIIVDSFVSISGKGELNMALERSLISKKNITELNTVLTSNENIISKTLTPVLFVSKGLAIEDYVFAIEIIGRT
jgi:ornithine cyclodeaminase/alanine dehydrogenase-like protein (mu-crystallin family)